MVSLDYVPAEQMIFFVLKNVHNVVTLLYILTKTQYIHCIYLVLRKLRVTCLCSNRNGVVVFDTNMSNRGASIMSNGLHQD